MHLRCSPHTVLLGICFDTTSLTPVERQVVYQTANFENECEYCVPWHTYLAKRAKMLPQDIEALRLGARLSDPKLEALRTFTPATDPQPGQDQPRRPGRVRRCGL